MSPKFAPSVRIVLTSILVAMTAIAGAAASDAGLSAEEGAAAVRKHIETQSAKHGSFWVYDAVANESLRLSFKSLDQERFGLTESTTYFASAHMTDESGSPFIVDVFLRGTDPEKLEVLEVTIQERDGAARYDWQREDGLWSRSGQD
ncbi:MAG: hypothetical protein AAF604_06065 [Acidobacteriota bacterium]